MLLAGVFIFTHLVAFATLSPCDPRQGYLALKEEIDAAIGLIRATPVFAEIDSRTFNINPNCIEDAITPKTRAILPVHGQRTGQ